MQRDVYVCRMACVLVALLGAFAGVARHIYDVQIRRHDYLYGKAREKYTSSRTLKGQRGSIRGVEGNLLAGNLACYNILAEPWRFRDEIEFVAGLLSTDLEVDGQDLRNRFRAAASPEERFPTFVVKQDVPPAQLALIRFAQLPGIELCDPPRQQGSADADWTDAASEILDLLGNESDKPKDVSVNTRHFRGTESESVAMCVLTEALGVERAALESRFAEAKRERQRLQEVVVATDVDIDLAQRIKSYRDIQVKPHLFRERIDDVSELLAAELGIPTRFLRRRFLRVTETEERPVEITVKRAVQEQVAARIAKLRIRGVRDTPTLTGLRFVDSSRRFYPKGALLANVLGFTNADNTGVTGVEKLMDVRLHPVPEQTVFERDRRGNQLGDTPGTLGRPRDGDSVYLTISEPIQHIVEDELAKMVEAYSPRAAYAVMLNPDTGAVMAMAQWPSFNPNERADITPAQWQNRLLVEGFEPGSVMKCIAIAGALDYGVVTLDTVFDCEKGYWIYCRRPLRDSHPYEDLPVREIVQKSSNIGTAKIALAMGENRLFQTLHRFGFGQSTGIEFPGEASGIFRPLDRWDGLSVSRFPIGQGILVTPLQLAQAYCAIANDGVMMQPHIIDHIENPASGVIEVTMPEVKARVLRPGVAREITSAMVLVTEEGGTARKAAVEGYDVAGKTGTAQKVVDGQYSWEKYVASFVGFVPAEAPAFVLVVSADEPDRSKGYYGGTVAAPVFSRIAEKTLRYLEIAPAHFTAMASSAGAD